MGCYIENGSQIHVYVCRYSQTRVIRPMIISHFHLVRWYPPEIIIAVCIFRLLMISIDLSETAHFSCPSKEIFVGKFFCLEKKFCRSQTKFSWSETKFSLSEKKFCWKKFSRFFLGLNFVLD